MDRCFELAGVCEAKTQKMLPCRAESSLRDRLVRRPQGPGAGWQTAIMGVKRRRAADIFETASGIPATSGKALARWAAAAPWAHVPPAVA